MSFTSAVVTKFIEFAYEPNQLQTAYRRMAKEIKAVGCQGPIASSGVTEAACGLYLACHLNQPFSGCSMEHDVAATESALKEFGVQTLIVNPNRYRSRKFIEQTLWTNKIVLIDDHGSKLYVYVPPDGSQQIRPRQSEPKWDALRYLEMLRAYENDDEK